MAGRTTPALLSLHSTAAAAPFPFISESSQIWLRDGNGLALSCIILATVWIVVAGVLIRRRSKGLKHLPFPDFEPEEIVPLLTEALEAAPFGIGLANRDAEFIWVNEALSNLTGYARRELLGKTPTLIVEEGGEELDFDEQWEKILGGAAWRGEGIGVRKDGSLYTERQVVKPLAGLGGEVPAAVVIVDDVSEHRKDQSDLAIKNRFLQRAEEIARIGYWRISLPSERLDWSDEIYRIHGVDPGNIDLTIRRAIHFYHPDDRKRVSKAIARAMEHGDEFEFELRIVRPDGEIRHVAARGECLQNAEGAVDAVFGVFKDITEQKEYEELLLLAKEEAETANRFKSMLLSNINQELRTPLTTILGYSRLLMEEAPPECREFVSSILFGGRRLLSTLESVMELSRLEKDRDQVVADDAVDLCSLVVELVDGLAPRAAVKGLTLRGRVPISNVEVLIDARYLRWILENLIDNAIKFTERGEISVDVRDRTRRTGNVQICVRDTGPGIDPELLPHIFDAFRRGPNAPARIYEGVGLGLTIAKHLAELMGGGISVTTEVGAGSRFTLTLPERPGNRPLLNRARAARISLTRTRRSLNTMLRRSRRRGKS